MLRFLVNRDLVETEWGAGVVLLDFLRRERRLTGVKEGCREGDCGACLVLIGELEGDAVRWRPVNSCLFPLGDCAGRHVVTIEGLNGEGLTPPQAAIVEEGATQCGFCTPGFVVALTAWLLNARDFTAEEAEDAAAGNLCRCTGYLSLRRAFARLAERFAPLRAAPPDRRLRALIAAGVVPADFAEIAARLREIAPPPAPAADAVPVGGGTDLFVQRAESLAAAPLRFLRRDPALRGIRRENGDWRIGGAATIEELARARALAEALPGFAAAFPLISSRPIRERATVAGNLVNASPIGDLTILLLALDAELVLRGPAGERTLPLRRFFLGYKKLDRRPDELVAEIRFRQPPPDARFHFEKVSRRERLDIAAVNGAALFEMEGPVIRRAALSAGGVAPIPLRLAAAEAALAGRKPDAAALRAAQAAAEGEIAPIDDVRGSAAYKRALLRALLAAHFEAAGGFQAAPDPGGIPNGTM